MARFLAASLLIWLLPFMAGEAVAASKATTTPSADDGPSLADLSGKFGEFEVGNIYAYQTDLSVVTENRYYLLWKKDFTFPSLAGTDGASPVSLHGAFRAWTDMGANEVDLRALSIEYSALQFKIEAGFQEIPWGETFGLFIADIVNPRDNRDPLFNELSWVRIPVAAISAQVFLNSLTIQGVLTPIARQSIWPTIAPPVGVTLRPAPSPTIDDAEFGGRVSYLFSDGLDLGLFYYHHLNRNLVYELKQLTPTNLVLDQVQVPVNTIGMTMSYAVGIFVLRGDSVATLDLPQGTYTFQPVRYGVLTQTILGADATLESQTTLGFQYHVDTDLDGYDRWVSGKVSQKFWKDRIEADLFAFVGLDTPDVWVQPMLTWSVNGSLAVSARADLIEAGAPGEGLLWPLRDKSRVLSWITFKF